MINCIGKIGEKVVADQLQEAGLLHRHQYGSVKGRSALEVVFRAVTRAQRCLAKGGSVAWGFWDVKGGFQNVIGSQVEEYMSKTEIGRRWNPWMKNFFRARQFTISWDGKDRGNGRTNIGAPQGSPLSPVVFLIWMAPILEDMERRVRKVTGTDIELPSYVDDIHLGIYEWTGKAAGTRDDGLYYNEEELLTRASTIVKEVASECELPMEDSKEESLILRPRGQRRRGKERKWVKWLGIILDEDLEFDVHWKKRIDIARKMLGTLNGIGTSQ